ncbi:MAG: hypothetical protein F4X40_05175 [Chloroflexi bacterium]|nr:hypothetical protein [Chloroflexota bacterium]
MCSELEAAVQHIFDEAYGFARQFGGVDNGMTVLYGPPIAAPDVMIVSAQGGADELFVQTSWPTELAYLNPNTTFRFGNRLRRGFEEGQLADTLAHRTVATNIAFPQAKSFDRWLESRKAPAWLARSICWVDELIRLMQPKVILTYGKHAFGYLTDSTKSKGDVAETTYRHIPVLGCGHLSQGTSSDEHNRALTRVRLHIPQGG